MKQRSRSSMNEEQLSDCSSFISSLSRRHLYKQVDPQLFHVHSDESTNTVATDRSIGDPTAQRLDRQPDLICCDGKRHKRLHRWLRYVLTSHNRTFLSALGSSPHRCPSPSCGVSFLRLASFTATRSLMRSASSRSLAIVACWYLSTIRMSE